jgi:hypothetical protein
VNNIIIKCLAAVPALALTAGAGLAQDFTAGKTPAQLFASDCSACHRSPDGLGKKYNAGSLTGFLRAHYTTKQETAGSLAKYVIGFAAARPVATTSPTAEDARSPDGKHRSDVSSDGEKKPRAKPPGTVASEDHPPPVPQPAQPAPPLRPCHRSPLLRPCSRSPLRLRRNRPPIPQHASTLTRYRERVRRQSPPTPQNQRPANRIVVPTAGLRSRPRR